jgi:hypothetical protein
MIHRPSDFSMIFETLAVAKRLLSKFNSNVALKKSGQFVTEFKISNMKLGYFHLIHPLVAEDSYLPPEDYVMMLFYLGKS